MTANLNLNRLVRDAERLLRPLLPDGVSLIMDLSPEIPSVDADEDELRRVFMMHAVNAVEAMKDGGTLIVCTANATLVEGQAASSPDMQPRTCVELTVKQALPGSPGEETQGSALKPPTSPSIEHGIAQSPDKVIQTSEVPGSQVYLESHPDPGTIFRIRFVPSAEDASAGDEKTPMKPGGGAILVCDDEYLVLRSTCWLLEARGYPVFAASNGREALDLVSANPGKISLLLTDIVMPQMDGPELAKSARGLWPEMKVIFMSGYDSETLQTECGMGEHAGVLQKPIQDEVLYRSVRATLGEPEESS